MNLENIKKETAMAIDELVREAGLEAGDIFVIGCSSSEIVGNKIGKGSSIEAAQAVFEEAYGILSSKGIYLAAQCCEHLNRAIIIEKKCAQEYGYDVVCVKPQPFAGGSFATVAYDRFSDPVAIEHVKAHAGIDIGETLIGMHLRDVAVPVRLGVRKIGEANIIAARTRPKYIGGPRACYPD